MTNSAIIPESTRTALLEAIAAGDANATVQTGIEIGCSNSTDIWAAGVWLGATNHTRPGFWRDVETLLRLETASDEPTNAEAPNPEPTQTSTRGIADHHYTAALGYETRRHMNSDEMDEWQDAHHETFYDAEFDHATRTWNVLVFADAGLTVATGWVQS